MSSGYIERKYVKILMYVKAFERGFTNRVVYGLGEGFSVYYDSHVLKRTKILKRKNTIGLNLKLDKLKSLW